MSAEDKNERYVKIAHCLISLANVETLDENKRQWLLKRIDTLGFLTDDQRQALRDAIDHPKTLEESWRAIIDNHDRAYVLDQALAIFKADGRYCDDEKKAYQALYDDHFSQFDNELLQFEIQNHAHYLKEARQNTEKSFSIMNMYFCLSEGLAYPDGPFYMHLDDTDTQKRTSAPFASRKNKPTDDKD